MKFKTKVKTKWWKKIGIGTTMVLPLFASLSFAATSDVKRAEVINRLRNGESVSPQPETYVTKHHEEQYKRGDTLVQYAQDVKSDGSNSNTIIPTPGESNIADTNPFSFFIKEKFSNNPILLNNSINFQHSSTQFSPMNYTNAFAETSNYSGFFESYYNPTINLSNINKANFVNKQLSVPWTEKSFFDNSNNSFNLLPLTNFNALYLFEDYLNNHNLLLQNTAPKALAENDNNTEAVNPIINNNNNIFKYEFIDMNKNEYFTYRYSDIQHVSNETNNTTNFLPSNKEHDSLQLKQDISEIAQFWTNSALLYLQGWGMGQSDILTGIDIGTPPAASITKMSNDNKYKDFAKLNSHLPPKDEEKVIATFYTIFKDSISNNKISTNSANTQYVYFPFLDFRFNHYNLKEDSFDITNILNHLFAINYNTDNFGGTTSAYNDGDSVDNNVVKERYFGISINPLILYSIANMHNALQFYYECLSTPILYFTWAASGQAGKSVLKSYFLGRIEKKNNKFIMSFEEPKTQAYSPFSFIFTKNKFPIENNTIQLATNTTNSVESSTPAYDDVSVELSASEFQRYFPVSPTRLNAIPNGTAFTFTDGFKLSDLLLDSNGKLWTGGTSAFGVSQFMIDNWINNKSKLDVTKLNSIYDDPRWFDGPTQIFKTLFMLKTLILTGALTNFYEVSKMALDLETYSQKDSSFIFPSENKKTTFYSPWLNNNDFGLSENGTFDFLTADTQGSKIALSLAPALWWKIASHYQIPMDSFNKILGVDPTQIISFNANILKPGLFGQESVDVKEFSAKPENMNIPTESFSNTLNVQVPMIQLWWSLLSLSDANIVDNETNPGYAPLSLLAVSPDVTSPPGYSYANIYAIKVINKEKSTSFTDWLIKMYWKDDNNSKNPWKPSNNPNKAIEFNLKNEIYTPLMHNALAEVGAGLSIQPNHYFQSNNTLVSGTKATSIENRKETLLDIKAPNNFKLFLGGIPFLPEAHTIKDYFPFIFKPEKKREVIQFKHNIINPSDTKKSASSDTHLNKLEPKEANNVTNNFSYLNTWNYFNEAFKQGDNTHPLDLFVKILTIQLREGIASSKYLNFTKLQNTDPLNKPDHQQMKDNIVFGYKDATLAPENLNPDIYSISPAKYISNESLSFFPSIENNLYSRLTSNLQLETFSYSKRELINLGLQNKKDFYAHGFLSDWPNDGKNHPLYYFFSKGLFSKSSGATWTYWATQPIQPAPPQEPYQNIPTKTQAILKKPDSPENNKQANIHLPKNRTPKIFSWLNTDFNFSDQTSIKYRPNFLSTIYSDVTTNVKTLVNILETSFQNNVEIQNNYYQPLLEMMNKLPTEILTDKEFKKSYLSNRFNPRDDKQTPSDGLGLFYQFNKNFIDNNIAPGATKVSQYGLKDLGMDVNNSLSFTAVENLLAANGFTEGDPVEMAKLLSDLLGALSLHLNWNSISGLLKKQSQPEAVSKQVFNLYNFAKRLNLKYGSQTISARDFPYSTDVNSDYQLFSATKPSDLTINNIVHSSILIANKNPYALKNEYGVTTNLSPSFLKQMLLYSPSKNYGDTSLPTNYYDIISADPAKAFNERLDPEKEPRRPGLAIAIKQSDLTKSLTIKLIIRNPDVTKVPSPLLSFINSGSNENKIVWDRITATPLSGNSKEDIYGEDKFSSFTLTITDIGWSRTGPNDGVSSGNDEEKNNRPIIITSLEELLDKKLYLVPLKNPKYNELLDYIKNFKVSGDNYDASAERQKPSDSQIALISQLFTFKNKKGQKYIIAENVWKQLINTVNTANSRIVEIGEDEKKEKKLTSFSIILDLSHPLFVDNFNPSLKEQQVIINKTGNVSMIIKIPEVEYNTKDKLDTTWQISDILFVVFASLIGAAAIGVGIWFLLRYLKRRNFQK